MPPYRMIGKVSILNKQTSLLIFDKHPSTDSPTALQNREEEMNKSISEDKSKIENKRGVIMYDQKLKKHAKNSFIYFLCSS